MPVGPVVPVVPVGCSGSVPLVLCLTFLSGVISVDLGDRTLAAIDGSASGCIPATDSTSFRVAFSYGIHKFSGRSSGIVGIRMVQPEPLATPGTYAAL